MTSSTPTSPLHDALPAEIGGLKMQQYYGRCEPPVRECTVLFDNNKLTIKSRLNGELMTNTFCSRRCFELVTPLTDTDLKINIRHGCIEGWRMVFKAADKEVLSALKDAIMRTKHDQLFSFNLLMDDRCEHLNLKSRGLTQDQITRMRKETTSAVPKGTVAEFKLPKTIRGVSLRVVNACPAMRVTSSAKCTPENITVKEGVVTCKFDDNSTKIEAAAFYPPRVVSPPSDDEQIFVCDSIDKWNPRQAWVFETDRAHVAALLDVLMHAWMTIEDQKEVKEVEPPLKKEKPSIAKKGRPALKEVGPKRGRVVVRKEEAIGGGRVTRSMKAKKG